MNNSKELKVKYHGNKEKPSRFKNRNVASMSKLGYRDDSPYNTLPYIDVHTPSGRIDMSDTGIPLWANGRILPPYSGVHQFDTTQVKEIPLAQKGKQTGNPISDWWYNLDDVQSTYKMYNDLDPFLKNWFLNPETQKRLAKNMEQSYVRFGDPRQVLLQATNTLNDVPIFSRELVKKADISHDDIEYNNELQGWNTSSDFGGSPYFSGINSFSSVINDGLYDRKAKQIIVNSFNDLGTIAHEGIHATGPFQTNMEAVIDSLYGDKRNPEQRFIERYSDYYWDPDTGKRIYEPLEKIKNRVGVLYESEQDRLKYLDSDGMYPRIMDIRRSLNLKPGQKVTKDILENRSIMGPLDDLKMYYDDDTIIDMLNTIAKNKSTATDINQAKQGGPNNWLKKYQDENSLVTTTTRFGLSDEPPPAWRDAVYLPTVEISAPKTYKQKLSEVMDAVPGYALASMAGPLGILGHYAYNKALENLGDLDTSYGYNVPLEHVVNVATGISSDDLSQGDMKKYTESDALRMYLGLPQEHASFKPSKTTPNAYEINGYEQFFPERLDNLPSKGYISWEGDPEEVVGDLKPWGDMVMGRHTVTSGQDKKGFYLEYKDVWDLDTYDMKVSDLLEKAGLNKYAIWDTLGQDTKNKKVPLGEIADKTIGKPFDIRGRIYYIKDPKTGKYVREDIISKKKKQDGGSLPMAQDGTEALFQKYYGQVDRSDTDPAGFDYYMYRNPEFKTLSSADRLALIKRMKNFLQYESGPRATQAEDVDTNTVFPDTPEQVDRRIRQNTKLQTNKDLTPKKPFGHGSYEYEDYKSGGSWLEQYQDKKSIVDTVKAKYASRPSSAPSEKQSDIILNVPKTLTAQKSTTDTGINKKNIESELEINSRYVSPGSYGKGEIFTENYINKLKKDYNVDLEYDPADPFFRIAGLFGNPPGAYYNPFTRTINYGTEFGYEELDPETHPYVRHDMLMHEIPHAIQFDRHKSVIGKLGEARNMLSGLFMDQDARYNTPGTFEHEAHHILEKKLRKDFDKAWDEWDGETVRRKGGSWLNQYE